MTELEKKQRQITACKVRIGVNDEFGHSSPAAALLKQFGLSSDHIIEAAKELCN